MQKQETNTITVTLDMEQVKIISNGLCEAAEFYYNSRQSNLRGAYEDDKALRQARELQTVFDAFTGLRSDNLPD